MNILDNNIPARPTMPTVSRELYNSNKYSACITKLGLIVQRHSTGKGVLLPKTHKQYSDYLDAISEGFDLADIDSVCRALMSNH